MTPQLRIRTQKSAASMALKPGSTVSIGSGKGRNGVKRVQVLRKLQVARTHTGVGKSFVSRSAVHDHQASWDVIVLGRIPHVVRGSGLTNIIRQVRNLLPNKINSSPVSLSVGSIRTHLPVKGEKSKEKGPPLILEVSSIVKEEAFPLKAHTGGKPSSKRALTCTIFICACVQNNLYIFLKSCFLINWWVFCNGSKLMD